MSTATTTIETPPPAPRVATFLLPMVAAATLLPWVSSAVALLGGVAFALALGNPWPAKIRELARQALTWSVVALGAGMDLRVVGRVDLVCRAGVRFGQRTARQVERATERAARARVHPRPPWSSP